MKYLVPLRIFSAISMGVFLFIAKKTNIPTISGTFNAKISFVTLQAAISPIISGSSTKGVNISIFFTKTTSEFGIGIIAASSISPVNPAPDKRFLRFFAPSLQDHP